MRWLAIGAVLVAAPLAACGSSGSASPAPAAGTPATAQTLRVPQIPPVPELPTWPDDPTTPEKETLGATIFFDERLSGTGKTNCNSCHLAATVYQDNLVAATPDRSKPTGATPKLPRNTLSFLNIVYAPVTRWDGSLGAPTTDSSHAPADDLIETIAFPFAEPNMNLGLDVATAQVALQHKLTVEVPGYVALYRTAFGADITSAAPHDVWRLTGRALRAYLRGAVSRDSAFDKWNAGDDTAMGEDGARGVAIFTGKGKCIACHSGALLSDHDYHNVSTSPPGPGGARLDEGRYYLTRKEEDRGRFLTPMLRGAYDTGPYFHSGRLPDGTPCGSLPAALRYLASPAVLADPNHDGLFAAPLDLSDRDISDLVAFLRALRGAPISPVPQPHTMPQ